MTITRNRFLVAAAALLLCLVACFTATGCSSSALQIGSTSDSSTISATNKTGQSITAVAIKSSSNEAYDSALEQDSDWENDAVAEIHFSEPESEASATSEDDTDLILNNLQSISFTTADGMTYELHQLNLSDIQDASLYLEDQIAYLEYTSVSTGEEVNTLDAEKAYQEQVAAEAAEKAAAEEQAAAEQAAAEKAAKTQASETSSGNSSTASTANNQSSSSAKSSTSSSNSSNSSSKSSSSSSSSKGSSSSSSSSEDVCVDDLVFN
jgi:hypothetical protein